jgi:predicted RNase H-like HicB family nuclease
MTHYIGVLEGADDNWGVWFPDIMGCVGAGTTREAAIADAASALALVARMTVDDGETLPAARSHSELLKEPWVEEAVRKGDVLIAIPLYLESGRTVRANISVDAGTLALVDAAAKARGLTRSAFLVSAARDKILSEV